MSEIITIHAACEHEGDAEALIQDTAKRFGVFLECAVQKRDRAGRWPWSARIVTSTFARFTARCTSRESLDHFIFILGAKEYK